MALFMPLFVFADPNGLQGLQSVYDMGIGMIVFFGFSILLAIINMYWRQNWLRIICLVINVVYLVLALLVTMAAFRDPLSKPFLFCSLFLCMVLVQFNLIRRGIRKEESQ